jgi:YD repeat-containing protein
MRRGLALVAVVASMLSAAAWAAAQPAAIHYVYDALNRLTAVVDQQGGAATYTYDAVGNILKVDRVDPPAGAVAISLFTPRVGATGSVVQIFGRGFGVVTGDNVVAFNGVAATVRLAAANRLVATVPSAATTGRISITTPRGSATSAVDFRVLGLITISPAGLTIPVGATRDFTAAEAGTPTTAVRWLVNGIPGGEPSTGTISDTGVYTAPPTLPFPAAVTVTASHTADSSASASAPVTIVRPQPLFLASRGVTVAMRSPARVIDHSVTASVSVAIAAGGGAAFSTAPPVSVRLAAIPHAFAAGSAVSVSLAPVVATVTPSFAPAGSTALEVTLTGFGLTDAIAVSFHRNGARDPHITTTDLVVNAEGTEAIVEIAIAPEALSGPRVVRVTTPVGISTGVGANGNLFTIP